MRHRPDTRDVNPKGALPASGKQAALHSTSPATCTSPPSQQRLGEQEALALHLVVQKSLKVSQKSTSLSASCSTYDLPLRTRRLWGRGRRGTLASRA
jgi:hypothetical protein